MLSLAFKSVGALGVWGEKGYEYYRDQRTKEEEFIKCDRCLMWAISTIGEAEGSCCCQKYEEIAHLRMVITRLKERMEICSK